MYQRPRIIDCHAHLLSMLFAEDIIHPCEDPLKGEAVSSILTLMDKHGVDQAVGLIAMGLSDLPLENDLTIRIAEAAPERFPAVLVGFELPEKESWLYDPKKAADQIAEYMKHPQVKGLGELLLDSLSYMAEWPVIWDRLRPVFDVLADTGGCALIHTGPSAFIPKAESGVPGERPRSRRSLWFNNPIFIDDIATEYPEVPILIGHAGAQAYFYYGSYADMALAVAARHENVYLETSSVPFEVLQKVVADPALGPEKLIFGTDSPAFYYHYKGANGEYYSTYAKGGPKEYMPDHYKYDMSNIERLPISEYEKLMIFGGNAEKVFGIS